MSDAQLVVRLWYVASMVEFVRHQFNGKASTGLDKRDAILKGVTYLNVVYSSNAMFRCDGRRISAVLVVISRDGYPNLRIYKAV